MWSCSATARATTSRERRYLEPVRRAARARRADRPHRRQPATAGVPAPGAGSRSCSSTATPRAATSPASASTTWPVGRWPSAHLLERGHRRVAFVGGPSTLRQVRDRRRGRRRPCRPATGRRCSPISTPALTTAAGRAAAEELVASRTPSAPRPSSPPTTWSRSGSWPGSPPRGCGCPRTWRSSGTTTSSSPPAAAVPLSSVRQPRAELGRRGGRARCSRRSAAGGRAAPEASPGAVRLRVRHPPLLRHARRDRLTRGPAVSRAAPSRRSASSHAVEEPPGS